MQWLCKQIATGDSVLLEFAVSRMLMKKPETNSGVTWKRGEFINVTTFEVGFFLNKRVNKNMSNSLILLKYSGVVLRIISWWKCKWKV